LANHRACLAPLICALGASLWASAPTEALAQTNSSLYTGLFLTVSFGDKPSLGLGVGLRLAPLRTCAGNEGGIFAQASLLNFSLAWRMAAGFFAETPRTGYRLNGELGWAYRSALGEESPAGHGPHVAVGALAEKSKVDLALRGTVLLRAEDPGWELSPAVGPRVYPRSKLLRIPTSSCTTTVDGRPLFVEQEQRHAPLCLDRAWG